MDAVIKKYKGVKQVGVQTLSASTEDALFLELFKLNRMNHSGFSFSFSNKLLQNRYDIWLNSEKGFNTILTLN
jgi:hypothetical protein